MFVTNTGFIHHLRRKTTWISPGGRTKNDIDYIMIISRFKSSALNCRAYPKADGGSHHNSVAVRLKDYLEGICLHLYDCIHSSQAGIAYKYIRGLKKPFTLRSRTIKYAQDPLTTPTRSEKDGGATQNHCIQKIRQSRLNGSQYQVL